MGKEKRVYVRLETGDELGSRGSRPATCDLFTRSQVSEWLRLLKVKPEQLRKAARKAAANRGYTVDYGSQPANAELLTVINEVSQEVAATLEPMEFSTNGRAATVRTDVEFEIVS